jgi:hypothetical protein
MSAASESSIATASTEAKGRAAASVRRRFGVAALIAVHAIAAIGLTALARLQTDPFRTANFWLLLLLVTQASLLAVWAAAGGAPAYVFFSNETQETKAVLQFY